MQNSEMVAMVAVCRVVLTTVVLAMSARASDASATAVLGFSADGRMMAFERYGTHDGSAFPFCDVFFVNVDSNTYASKPVRVRIDDNLAEDTARSQALRLSRVTMERLGIVRGDSGTAVVCAGGESTDSSLTFVHAGKKWTLVLSTRQGPVLCEEEYGGGKIFTLSVRAGSRVVVLQNDTELPKSRGCPFSYGIDHARMKGDRIAVFIRYSTPGYEGPDTRQIVVTGRLSGS